MQNYNIGCVVMAAGNAARFGENKLAAIYEGNPLIRHALEAVPKGLNTVVVTQYDEVESMAAEFGFASIHNAHPDFGISHTIKLGTQALRDCDAILYLVSDQPLLKQSSVARVVDTWMLDPEHIIGAAHNGKRGNPCIFPKKYFEELMQLREDHGGNTVIRAHPEALRTVEIEKAELTDVDTPKALHDLKIQEAAE